MGSEIKPACDPGVDLAEPAQDSTEDHIGKYRCRSCGSHRIMVLAWTDGNTGDVFLYEDVDYPEVDLVLCRDCNTGDTYFLIPDQPFKGPTHAGPNPNAGMASEREE